MKTTTKRAKVAELAAARGVLRASDLGTLGISPRALYDLVSEGVLEQVGRGMFVTPDYAFTEHHGLVEVAAYAPRGVICLLSALQFHRLGTQLPHVVWLGIANKSRTPKVPTAPIEVVRMSAQSLAWGVETHILEGVPVRIFSAAKTIADCFKFRSAVGLDVAIEALKDALSKRLVTPGWLYECAKIDRVWEVMQPYLEALQ